MNAGESKMIPLGGCLKRRRKKMVHKTNSYPTAQRKGDFPGCLFKEVTSNVFKKEAGI